MLEKITDTKRIFLFNKIIWVKSKKKYGFKPFSVSALKANSGHAKFEISSFNIVTCLCKILALCD